MRKYLAVSLVFIGLLAAWLLWQRGCDRLMPDIDVAGGAVLVRNQTTEDWTSVRIWVTDCSANELRAGSFVREPVARFVAAQGQTLKSSARITSVVVLATSASGKPVRVVWGQPALH